MKNKTLALILLLYSFIALSSLEIVLSPFAASLDVADIDLDGDLDIVVGHNQMGEETWGGITLIKNINYEFVIDDTLYLSGYHDTILFSEFNDNLSPDLITNYFDWNSYSHKIAIINDIYEFQLNNIFYIDISHYAAELSMYYDNNNLTGLTSISNPNQLFSAIPYHFDTGFSEPEYFQLDYPPTGVAVGDILGDSRDEIVVCGADILIFNQTQQSWESTLLNNGINASEVAISDIDNDGINEILTYNIPLVGDDCILRIYKNINDQFDLVFEQIFSFPSGLKIFDHNNDDLPDLLLGHRLITNLGNLTFSEPVILTYGCDNRGDFADMDNNGFLDIVQCGHVGGTYAGFLRITFNDGNGNFHDEPLVSINNEELIVNDFQLRNYPNPFNPSTTIEFSIQNYSEVELLIFNIIGQKIKTLAKNKFSKGKQSIIWNGEDDSGKSVSSGIYYYKLNVNGKTIVVQKCLLLK